MSRQHGEIPRALTGMTVPVFMALLLQFLGLPMELEYRRPLLLSEPWRLFTGHFVHLSWLHAVLNCVALLILERLFEGRLRRSELWLVLVGAPVLISTALWIALPQLEWYRGLSGTLHAIFFAGSVTWASTTDRARWLPVAALAGGTIKVLLEQPWEPQFPFQEWLGAAVVPQAHLAGALSGVVAGFFFAMARRRKPASKDRMNERD
ncbi:MAG: rhombosortase [Gammaproteobacteria bacterium]